MAKRSAASNLLLFDISRLVGRRHARTATGIDRVEIAYAGWALRQHGFDVVFASQVGGRLRLIPESISGELVDCLARRWNVSSPLARAERPLDDGFFLREPSFCDVLDPLLGKALRSYGRCVYLNVSHHGIDNGPLYLHLLTKYRTQFAFFIHDLIPIQFPEYVRLHDDEGHAKRLRAILPLDPLIIANSKATREALTDWCAQQDLPAPNTVVCHIGVEPHFLSSAPPPPEQGAEDPYFVMIGTIEPRKNHLLLLNVWRDLAQSAETTCPRLVVVGKRGWENENILAVLDRGPLSGTTVRELNDVSDRDLIDLMRNARALLFPSFGEGWGMPLVESLALGTPAICSDLKVFREAGQSIPDFLSPIDGLGWRQAVLDYCPVQSARRKAQMRRLDAFKAPTWDAHFRALEQALDRLVRPAQKVKIDGRARIRLPGLDLDGFRTKNKAAFDDVASKKKSRDLIAAADAARDAGEYAMAAVRYLAALERDDRMAGIWVQAGNMLKDHGALNGAYEAYERALSLMPDDADLHVQFGHLMKIAGRNGDANFYYRMADQLDPSLNASQSLVV